MKQLHDAGTNEEKSQFLEEYFENSNSLSKPRRASQANPNENLHQGRADPQAAANVEVDESSEDEVTELLNETTVGEDGRIYFYGRTSHYHLQPAQICDSSVAERELSEAIRYRSAIHKDPSPGTSPQTDWGSIFTTDISQELVSELLDVYWCWPHHLHLVLCRRIFMRQLASLISKRNNCNTTDNLPTR